MSLENIVIKKIKKIPKNLLNKLNDDEKRRLLMYLEEINNEKKSKN